jgi:hypothetical protein
VSILSALQWLAATESSTSLRESLFVWPLVESTHVLSLMLFVGTTVMLDLRLLGITMKKVPVSEVTGRLLPWTRVGFTVMVITGLLLFFATPVRNYQNLFFRLKMILFTIAGLNVWLFHNRIHRRVADWDLDQVTPPAARMAAIVSLVAWTGVVVSGRLVAYNWFDCDLQPQSAFVNWAAGCVVEPSPEP